MGQIMNKARARKVEPEGKLSEQLQDIITKYIDANYERFENQISATTSDEQKKHMFFDFVHRTVQEINKTRGAMQYGLPNYEDLKKKFQEAHKGQNEKLTRTEFQKIIETAFRMDNLSFGQGFQEIVLYVMGFPVVASLAKRFILGPNSSIPDEIFIPFATSATVVYLAKTNKL